MPEATNEPVFLNFSNHPSGTWSAAQRSAVTEQFHAQIIDVPFPQVDAAADGAEIAALARSCAEALCSYAPAAVMCQGEYGLTYAVVQMLKEAGIRCVYSCSERRTSEQQTAQGTVKISEFRFVRFREY